MIACQCMWVDVPAGQCSTVCPPTHPPTLPCRFYRLGAVGAEHRGRQRRVSHANEFYKPEGKTGLCVYTTRDHTKKKAELF